MAFALALGVTPELLKAKSGQVSDTIEAMKQNINTMKEEVLGTDRYWLGEAGEAQRRKFTERYSEMERLMERLGTYPTRILQMAGIYEQAEETNVQIGASMAADVQLRW